MKTLAFYLTAFAIMFAVGTANAMTIEMLNKDADGNKMDPPIKSIFIYDSDPANCAPNTNNVRKGLMRDDLFVAVHETFWTDTCDYADIVIPADTQLERMDMVATYGNWYFNMNKPVIEPLGESVRNSELFRMLAKKMGYVEEGDFKHVIHIPLFVLFVVIQFGLTGLILAL